MDIKLNIPDNKLDEILSNNKVLNYLILIGEENENDEKFLTEVEKICNELKKECKDADVTLYDEFKKSYLAIPIGLRKSYLHSIIHKNITTPLDDETYNLLKRIVRSSGIDVTKYDMLNSISDNYAERVVAERVVAERIVAEFNDKYSDIPDFVSEMVDNDDDEKIRNLIDLLDNSNNIKKFIVDNNIIDTQDKIKVFKSIVLFLRSNFIKHTQISQ
jgi:hypothetical protein